MNAINRIQSPNQYVLTVVTYLDQMFVDPFGEGLLLDGIALVYKGNKHTKHEHQTSNI